MLAGDNMLYMMGKFAMLLPYQAIFASVSSPSAHAPAKELGTHATKSRLAFNLRIVIKAAPSINASYSASSSGVNSPSFARCAK